MNKSKVEFITDLLSNERLKPFHREKLYPLILSEIKQAGNVDEQLWNELQLIKDMIIKNAPPNVQSENLLLHDPVKTVEALSLFKTGNKLKWITHLYPNSEQDSFNYEKITENAIDEFNSISKYLPSKLRALIVLFLKPAKDPNKKAIWYLGNPYKTWWSEDIKGWCREHPGLHPDTNEELGKLIITPFKKSIEIRNGEELIQAINYRLLSDNLNKVQINFSQVKKSTRFFTGVDLLMSGIASLFPPIIERYEVSNRVDISTSISEINDRYVTVVTIQHLDSVVEKEFVKGKFLGGSLLSAKELLTSICDWTITANFSNGTFSIPVLKNGGEIQIVKHDNQVEGFTHQLIFY